MITLTASFQREEILRERAVVVGCASAALALGVLAVTGASAWPGFVALVLLCVIAAWTLPRAAVVLVLALLVPLQLYFTVPGSTFTMRAAVVFIMAVALRVLAGGFTWRAWMLPAGLFMLAAVVAALGASNRYVALKGVYNWLPACATAFVASEWVESPRLRRLLAGGLIAGGVFEAALGLVQATLGLDRVIDLLRLPVSDWFYQPNLLADRLNDLSFNWVIFDRAAPFGTFINGIDYAVYLASILVLTLALILARDTADASTPRENRRTIVLYACALVLGAALILTFKGSGLIGLAGGGLTIVFLLLVRSRMRVTRQMLIVGLVILLGALVLALPLSDLIGQRLTFLVQREQGGVGTSGRLEIWMGLLQVFGRHPWFGVGLDNALLFTEPMRTLRGGIVAYNGTTPESAFVAALVETGVIGFAGLMAWLGWTLARGYRHVCASAGQERPMDQAVAIGLAAALVALWLGNLTVASLTTDQSGMLMGAWMGMVWAKWNPL